MYREDEFYDDDEEIDTVKPTVQVRNLTNGKIYRAEIVNSESDLLWSVKFWPEGGGFAMAGFKNVNGTMVGRFLGQPMQLIISYK